MAIESTEEHLSAARPALRQASRRGARKRRRSGDDRVSYQGRAARERTEQLRALRLARRQPSRLRPLTRAEKKAAVAKRPRRPNGRVRDNGVSKEELLQFEGLVLEILPDARFRIRLDNGHELIAYTAGRMKKNRIKTLAGDRVTSRFRPTIWKRDASCFVIRMTVQVQSVARRNTRNSAAADRIA